MGQLRNPHPGEILKQEFLNEIGVSQNQLAQARHGSRHCCITSTLPRSKGRFGGRDARPVQGSIG